MEEDYINGDPAKFEKGKESMMRDAKGWFCSKKQAKRTDWGNEDVVAEAKPCCNKRYKDKDQLVKEAFVKEIKEAEKRRRISELLDKVEYLMQEVPEDMNTPEDALESIDNVIEAFTALREVCVHLAELEKPKGEKKCTCKKASCKKRKKELPKEILELAEELKIPVEAIVNYGVLDLNTGDLKTGKRR